MTVFAIFRRVAMAWDCRRNGYLHRSGLHSHYYAYCVCFNSGPMKSHVSTAVRRTRRANEIRPRVFTVVRNARSDWTMHHIHQRCTRHVHNCATVYFFLLHSPTNKIICYAMHFHAKLDFSCKIYQRSYNMILNRRIGSIHG